MKKTIVAAAVAALVAAPAAFADVTISGQINQEFTNGDDNDKDMKSGSNVDVVFSGSEDLGNGMKASFKIHRFYDDGDSNGTSDTDKSADNSISLSGDFGSVKVGRFEPYTVSAISSMMNIDASEDLDLEETSYSHARTEGGMQYVSPNFNGVTVGFEQFADESVTGNDTPVQTIFAQYSNAGLTVKAAQEKDDDSSATTTSIAATYAMGDFKLTAVSIDDDNGTSADITTNMYGATYTMGANQIAVGMRDSDTANNDDKIVSLKHSLSKRTSVYLVHLDDDSTGANDLTLMGVKHSF
jgi:predicted porin